MTKQELWAQVYMAEINKSLSTTMAESMATKAVEAYERRFGKNGDKDLGQFCSDDCPNTWASDGVGSKCLNCGHDVKYGQRND